MISKKIVLVSIILLSTVLLSSCMDSDEREMMNDGGLENYEKMGLNDQENMEKNIDDEKMIPVEGINGIGDGAESLDIVMEKDEMMKNMLTDSKGMTLYIFKKDTENVSNCSGECEVKWPVFYNENLKDNGYSLIKREDGKMQTTLDGQPLYYFFKDTKAGDMNGQGLKDVWFIVDTK